MNLGHIITRLLAASANLTDQNLGNGLKETQSLEKKSEGISDNNQQERHLIDGNTMNSLPQRQLDNMPDDDSRHPFSAYSPARVARSVRDASPASTDALNSAEIIDLFKSHFNNITIVDDSDNATRSVRDASPEKLEENPSPWILRNGLGEKIEEPNNLGAKQDNHSLPITEQKQLNYDQTDRLLKELEEQIIEELKRKPTEPTLMPLIEKLYHVTNNLRRDAHETNVAIPDKSHELLKRAGHLFDQLAPLYEEVEKTIENEEPSKSSREMAIQLSRSKEVMDAYNHKLITTEHGGKKYYLNLNYKWYFEQNQIVNKEIDTLIQRKRTDFSKLKEETVTESSTEINKLQANLQQTQKFSTELLEIRGRLLDNQRTMEKQMESIDIFLKEHKIEHRDKALKYVEMYKDEIHDSKMTERLINELIFDCQKTVHKLHKSIKSKDTHLVNSPKHLLGNKQLPQDDNNINDRIEDIDNFDNSRNKREKVVEQNLSENTLTTAITSERPTSPRSQQHQRNLHQKILHK
jgi:hypothetical protein